MRIKKANQSTLINRNKRKQNRVDVTGDIINYLLRGQAVC